MATDEPTVIADTGNPALMAGVAYLRRLLQNLTDAESIRAQLTAAAMPHTLVDEGCVVHLTRSTDTLFVTITASAPGRHDLAIMESQPYIGGSGADRIALWARTLPRIIAWGEDGAAPAEPA